MECGEDAGCLLLKCDRPDQENPIANKICLDSLFTIIDLLKNPLI